LFGLTLPPKGDYAVGNIFFNPDAEIREESKAQFEEIARDLGLLVLCWRSVPVQSSILGPVAKSKEPVILQPFMVLAKSQLKSDAKSTSFVSKLLEPVSETLFERQLYVSRQLVSKIYIEKIYTFFLKL
jgi:glutamate synthase (NADPH/NADH)